MAKAKEIITIFVSNINAMATTASITLTSDITGDATNLTSTATLTKADSNVTGLDQFTGVTTLVFSAAQSDKNIISLRTTQTPLLSTLEMQTLLDQVCIR